MLVKDPGRPPPPPKPGPGSTIGDPFGYSGTKYAPPPPAPRIIDAGGSNRLAPGVTSPASAPPPPGASLPPPSLPNIDWSSYLGFFGLPGDVRDRINQIFQTTGDVGTAAVLALGYIRGTQWYAATFPGIGEGIAKGLIADEAGYRQMLNQTNQLYTQYLGRSVTSDEFAGYLREGVDVPVIGKRLQADAYISANKQTIENLAGPFTAEGELNSQELQAYGRQKYGLDTTLGNQLETRLNQALAKYQTIFNGKLATPGFGIGPSGLTAQNLLGTAASGNRADVAAP